MCYEFIPSKFAARPESDEVATPTDTGHEVMAAKKATAREQAARPSYAKFMAELKRWTERKEDEAIGS